MYLDEKLNLANKGIDVIKKLNYVVPRRALVIIYKSLPRPNLDYDDVIWPTKLDSFCSKIESVRYKAALAITGSILGTS